LIGCRGKRPQSIAGAARHFILSLLLLPAALRAQAPGTGAGSALSGTVTDAASGRPVEGAVVLVLRTMLSGRTDLQGRFLFPNVPAGQYTVRVLAIGFAEDSATGVSVAAGAGAVVAVSLQPAPVDLADVVVTATRSPETSQQSGASVAVLTAQELKRRNATTLDQAIAFEPGVTFNGGQMDIRGATGLARGVGSRVLLLLDGHPILSGDGGEIDFASLPLLDVDRVEVVKGAFSAVYGSNALGGVVNILTTPLGDQPQSVARLHYGGYQYPDRYRYTSGQVATAGIGLQHSRRIGNLGARLFLGRETDDGFRQNESSSRWLARMKLASPAGSAHPWDAYAVWARERAGEFFTWRDSTAPFRADTGDLGDFEVDYKLLTGATLTPVAGATRLLRIGPYLNFNSVRNHFNDNQDYHQAFRVGNLADFSIQLGPRHTIDFGTDVAYTGVKSNFLGDRGIHDDAVFVQHEIRVMNQAAVSLGLRVDYHRASGAADELAASPKLAVRWRPASWISTRASFGGGYRAPSAIEQFVSTRQFGFKVIPNPTLRGERAWSGEIGMSGSPAARVRFDASVFRSEYRNLIGPRLVLDSVPPQAQFANLTRARVQGLDMSLRVRFVPKLLDFEGTYLLLKTVDLETLAALPYRSRHNFSGTLSTFQGLFDIDVRYRSKVEQVLAYYFDSRGPVTVVDARVGYRVAGVALQAKVSNLFQQFYVDVMERYPGAPRSVSLTAYREF